MSDQDKCFTCNAEMPLSVRYPERLCETCIKKAVNDKGEKLSFYNESVSGGFKSYNHATQTYGVGHTCYINGYECHANEAYMGGIVVVPTQNAVEKKERKQKEIQQLKKWALILCPLLGSLLLLAAYGISRNDFMNGGFTFFDVLFVAGALLVSAFVLMIVVKKRVWFVFACTLYGALAFYLVYYFDYKNDPFISGVAVSAATNTAVIAMGLVLSMGAIKKRNDAFLEKKSKKGPALWLILVLLPCFAVIIGYIYTSIKAEERIGLMLQTLPVKYTVATVTKIKHYTVRGKYSKREQTDLLLEYTVQGKHVYRVLSAGNSNYLIGTKVEVKYLAQQPDIFEITRTVE